MRTTHSFYFAGSIAVALVAPTVLGMTGCGGGDTHSGQGASTTTSMGGQGGAGGGFGGTAGGTGGQSSITPSVLCGPGVPNCEQQNVGPTATPSGDFPWPPDPGVVADGVVTDENGYIGLNIQKKQSDYLWVANDMNYGMGLVSKISTKPFPSAPTYREVARYPTFTCQSDAVNGSREGLVLGQNPPAAL